MNSNTQSGKKGCENGLNWCSHVIDCPFKGPDVIECPNGQPLSQENVYPILPGNCGDNCPEINPHHHASDIPSPSQEGWKREFRKIARSAETYVFADPAANDGEETVPAHAVVSPVHL